jgi:hypothetical protein
MVLVSAVSMAQAGLSNREDFSKECGIQNTTSESASGFVLSSGGEWSALSAGGSPGRSDSLVARVWHESNWMVEMHGALGQGMATMHSGEMCFDPQGQITQLIDRFMDMRGCGCVRITSLAFGADGQVARSEQKFVLSNTGTEIAAPEAAKGFPAVWGLGTLDQLPFYSLMNKK